MPDKHAPYKIEEIGRQHNREMLDILRENPIESAGLSLHFDREPDIFMQADLKYGPVRYVGFTRNGKLMGFGLTGIYLAYVKGKPEQVFHFTDLYVRKESRYKGFYYKASRLFFEEAYEKKMMGYSIVMQGNKNAESLISRIHERYPYIPHSKIIGSLDVRNIIITFRKKESKAYHVRKASNDDSGFIVSMLREEYSKRLFAPYIDDRIFQENLKKRPEFDIGNYYIAEENGKAVGVCAAWCCASFKQTRVLNYGGKFTFTRIIHSLLSTLLNIPSLPKKGEAFKEVYITDYAVKGRNPDILNALFCRIYNDYRKSKYNTLIFGSYESDGLLKAVHGFFNQSLKSHIVASSYDLTLLNSASEEACKPYIDIALL